MYRYDLVSLPPEVVSVMKVKESYKKKDKKERQEANFDQLKKEIAEAKAKKQRSSDKFPDLRSRTTAEYKQVLHEKCFETLPALDSDGAKNRRRIGGTKEEAE